MNNKEGSEKTKDFAGTASSPFLLWLFEHAGGAILSTAVAYFTKIFLTKWWKKEKDIDSNTTTK